MATVRSLLERKFQDFSIQAADRQREHRLWWLFFLYTFNFLLLLVLIFIAYPNAWFSPLVLATNRLVNSTLINGIILFLIIIVIPLKGIKKASFHSLGLINKDFPRGMMAFGGLYLIINLIFLVGSLLFHLPIWAPYWQDIGISAAIGALIAQIFGNVLFEETLYRGYFLPQFILKVKKLTPRHPILGINLGILTPSVLFALMHIPIRIFSGTFGWELVLSLLFLVGIGYFFSMIYIFTQNLYIAMAVHVLWNICFELFTPVISSYLILLVVAIIAGIFGIWKEKKQRKNETEIPSPNQTGN